MLRREDAADWSLNTSSEVEGGPAGLTNTPGHHATDRQTDRRTRARLRDKPCDLVLMLYFLSEALSGHFIRHTLDVWSGGSSANHSIRKQLGCIQEQKRGNMIIVK